MKIVWNKKNEAYEKLYANGNHIFAVKDEDVVYVSYDGATTYNERFSSIENDVNIGNVLICNFY